MATEPTADELVVLGSVIKPHGVRGEVRVYQFNPDSDLLAGQARLWLRQGDALREVAVRRVRRGPKGVLIMDLGGVSGRAEADALRHADLCVRRAVLPEPPHGEWYHRDLVGLAVRDDSGIVGCVEAVLPYPSVDCLAVRLEGRAALVEVPMADPWLVSVDLDVREARVTGLAELCELADS